MTEVTVPTTVTVDLQWRDNGFVHHTREYQQNEEQTDLVVRRGVPFRVFLRFNCDVSRFSFVSLDIYTESFGETRLEKSWILKEISKRFQDDEAHDCPLQMNVVKSQSNSRSICLQLTSKADAVISKFNITGVTLYRAPRNVVNTYIDTDVAIILIFNPFNIDDQVFMGVEKERHEFVMEDTGMLFLRHPKSWNGSGKPWFFGQFDAPVLECTLLLLAKSKLPLSEWSDPVKVARTLSAVINCQDEDGLLIGNWTGEYGDGRNPSEWTGSLKIFQEFYSTEVPVAFGQCWVFSGCLTSAGRTLGIPTRSVTNFSSAHDTNANLLIDRYYHESGERFEGKNTDSVWNFHVWNEMWMTRPDLGHKYRGWQAVDATPQELSGGCFQTGPCPLVAIKEGEINVPHDATFIYAEVNACIKEWVTKDNGETWTEARSDSKHVGECISTKSVGSNDRQDLTSRYKYDEGSPQELSAFERARQLAREAGAERLPDAGGQSDPDAELPVWRLRIVHGEQLHQGVKFGSDVTVEVAVKNVSDRDRAGSCFCAAALKNSYGRQLALLDAGQMKLDLPVGVESTQKLAIKAEQYMAFGHEEIDIFVLAAVTDTENRLLTMDHVIAIVYPDLLVKLPSRLTKDAKATIVLELQNDLAAPLTGAKFSIEGPGLRTDCLECQIDDVQPGKLATCTMEATFHRAGPTNLVASFNCKEITGIFKQAFFYVEYGN